MSPKQEHTVDHGANPVTFVCHPSTAEAVFLAGTFNGWDPTATPMMLGKDGQWTVSLTLAPGKYEYKFVVDHEWCCEPDCTALSPEGPHSIMNDFGTMNRVLQVK